MTAAQDEEQQTRLDPDSYDDVAEAFDRYSERTGWPITQCLMEMTGLQPGEQRLLDVACGSGIVTRRGAAIVGPAGKAVGIDLSPGQIAVARRKAQRQGCSSWCEYIVMDAMRLEFADDTFDVTVAQFPHLPDRRQCIAEMVRVLKPGGRFAICNGGGGAGTPTWPLKNAPAPVPMPPEARADGLFTSCLKEKLPELTPGGSGVNAAAAESCEHDRAPATTARQLEPQAALTAELEEAGLSEINLWSYAYTAPFASAEEAFEWESVRGSLYRVRHAKLDPQRVNEFRRYYLSKAQARLDEYGVLGITTGALFGVAKKYK